MTRLPETSGLRPATERIAALDIVRGLALFGVLQINLISFTGHGYLEGAYPTGSVGEILTWLRDALINGKAMSCFSMLFGVGLAIQMERAAARGASFGSFALRRLGALASIGATHAILTWNGDILLDYAVIGLVLLPFVKARVRTILVAAFGAFLLDISFRPILEAIHAPRSLLFSYWVEQFKWINPLASQAYGHGSWVEAARFRAWEWLHPGRAVHLISIFGCATQFFLGLALWRSKLIQDHAASGPSIRKLFHATFWLGLTMTLLGAVFQARIGLWRHGWRDVARIASYEGPMILLAFGYLMGALLLLQRERWKRLLLYVAPMGRMALTNYLSQSLICTWLFNAYGLGLWGRIPAAVYIPGGIGFYAIQMLWSSWWLTRFRFGPAEWLWRSMTYGTWQPFRIRIDSPRELVLGEG